MDTELEMLKLNDTYIDMNFLQIGLWLKEDGFTILKVTRKTLAIRLASLLKVIRKLKASTTLKPSRQPQEWRQFAP